MEMLKPDVDLSNIQWITSILEYTVALLVSNVEYTAETGVEVSLADLLYMH